ncbi:MAG: phosphodiester glycosidase family protein [Oscillospiraceae bacterium]|jgi:uncharacterized protein YigE (DUF2233 family)|nr:phosphodiester glycosidase family protein [Oscillospiraceae bacterium]
MKKRLLPVLLTALFVVSFTIIIVNSAQLNIGGGVELADGVFYTDNSIQNENYFVYTPNATVRPVVVYGSKLCNYGRFDSMAALLTRKDWNVVGGINGGFYNTAFYMPLGIVITEDILRSSDDGYHAIGFRSDGSAFIGDPNMGMTLNIGGDDYALKFYNKMREDGFGFALFSVDFFGTTRNKLEGRDAILVPMFEGDVKLNGSYEFKVKEIQNNTGPADLIEGEYILSLSNIGEEIYQQGMSRLNPGDTVTLNITADPIWNEAEYALGTMYRLVTDGRIDLELVDVPKFDETHPRTAIGLKADGSVVMYTVDGRQSRHSVGFTAEQTAERMLELGCRDALMLDGGGSTNFHARYIGDTAVSQINSPSDNSGATAGSGKERSVSNYIMLAATAPGSGQARNIDIWPHSATVYAHSRNPFIVRASDETCRPVNIDADFNLNGGWNGLEQLETPGEYTISVDYMGLHAEASVTVLKPQFDIELLTDFETGNFSGETDFYAISRETDKDFVRFGQSSARLEYSFEYSPGENAGLQFVPLNLPVADRMTDLSFWVYAPPLTEGGASGLAVYFENNQQVAIPLFGETRGNWQRVTVPLPFAGADVIGIGTSGGNFTVYPNYGSIWLDQFTAATSAEADSVPPVIELMQTNAVGTPSGAAEPRLTFQAQVSDNSRKIGNITLTLDGKSVGYNFDSETGTISVAEFAQPYGVHRMTLTVSDASGNLVSETLKLDSGAAVTSKFTDTAKHWAADYINYLAAQNIADGFDAGKGKIEFRPDAAITRAQFAVMLYRWFGAENPGAVTLDFKDAKDIPASATDAVAFVVNAGYIKGVGNNDGTISFAPNASLTRAHAMTIIGRMQPFGYPSTDVGSFSDFAEIPDWSLRFVGELVKRGIIEGRATGAGNIIAPNAPLTRAEIAKILTELR